MSGVWVFTNWVYSKIWLINKEVSGAYIEYLSEYPEQKELLLSKDVFVDDVKEMNGIFINKVIYNGR